MSLGAVTLGLYGSINPSSGTTQATGAYLVRWLDRLGNVVASTGADAGQSFAPPQVPTVSGLANGRWSEAATLISRDMDILPMYDTADGKGHVFIETSALLGLTVTVKVTKSDTSPMTIVWGDGSANEVNVQTGAVTITHLYTAGAWDMSFDGVFTMGYGTTGNPFIAGVSVTELWMRSTSTTIPAYSLNGTAFRTMAAIVGANGVLTVGDYAAQNCYELLTAPLPSTVTVGINGFSTCYRMRAIHIPAVTSVGATAYQSCIAVEIAYLPSLLSTGTSAFQSCNSLRSVVAPLLGAIGVSTFLGCIALVDIAFPSAVVIGATAFQGASRLASVLIVSATSIGASALQTCPSLLRLSLPSVVTIDATMMQSARSCESVIISPNCTSIGNLALDGLRNLRTLRIEAATPPVLASSASLADFDPRLVIQVPLASLATYQSASNWSTFAARMVGY